MWYTFCSWFCDAQNTTWLQAIMTRKPYSLGVRCAKVAQLFLQLANFWSVQKSNLQNLFCASAQKSFCKSWRSCKSLFVFALRKSRNFFDLQKRKNQIFVVAKWAIATTGKHTLSWHPRAFAMALGHWLNSNAQTCCLQGPAVANAKNASAASRLLRLLLCCRRMTAQGLYTLYFDYT